MAKKRKTKKDLQKKVWYKKVFKFLKKNWDWMSVLTVPIILGVIYAVVRRDNMVETVGDLREEYRKDSKKQQKEIEEEIDKRIDTVEKYEKAMEQIEEKYDEDEKHLEEMHKERVDSIVNDYQEDPEGFTREVADKYDINFKEE